MTSLSLLPAPCSHGQISEESQNESLRMYVSEEERIPDTSQLNSEQTHDTIAELAHSQDRLRKQNELLQNTVEQGDELNAALRTENEALGNLLRWQKQVILEAEKLTDEHEELQRLRAEQGVTISQQSSRIRQLDKENKDLKDQNETVTSEMSYILPERAKDKTKIASLSTALQALQQQMEEVHLSLDQKQCALRQNIVVNEQLENSLAEHSVIIQDQRNMIKELKSQLEEAIVFGRQGSGLELEEAPPTPQAICFADELLMSPHSWVESSGEDEVKEGQSLEVIEDKSVVQTKRWRHLAKALVSGVLAAGAFTLVFALVLLISLGGMASRDPFWCNRRYGRSCSDILSDTVRNLVDCYCKVHYRPVPF